MVRPGRWIEVVGTRWAFAFADGIVNFDSVEADREILARCQSLCEWAKPLRTTMEMLNSKAFYADVLLHHEYGDMINSDRFSGTRGDVAKQKVTAWLEERGVRHSSWISPLRPPMGRYLLLAVALVSGRLRQRLGAEM